jgi:hypothetical protein
MYITPNGWNSPFNPHTLGSPNPAGPLILRPNLRPGTFTLNPYNPTMHRPGTASSGTVQGNSAALTHIVIASSVFAMVNMEFYIQQQILLEQELAAFDEAQAFLNSPDGIALVYIIALNINHPGLGLHELEGVLLAQGASWPTVANILQQVVTNGYTGEQMSSIIAIMVTEGATFYQAQAVLEGTEPPPVLLITPPPISLPPNTSSLINSCRPSDIPFDPAAY